MLISGQLSSALFKSYIPLFKLCLLIAGVSTFKNGLLKSDYVYHLPIMACVFMWFHSNVTLEGRLPEAQPLEMYVL